MHTAVKCLAGFPGGALVPDLVNQSHQLFASHQGDSLNQLASVAVEHPMTSEGLVDASAGKSTASVKSPVYFLLVLPSEQALHVLGKSIMAVATCSSSAAKSCKA